MIWRALLWVGKSLAVLFGRKALDRIEGAFSCCNTCKQHEECMRSRRCLHELFKEIERGQLDELDKDTPVERPKPGVK